MAAENLLITGTVGVGKTTVAEAAGQLLAGREVPHAVIDLDQIRLLWPSPDADRFNLAIELRNLASLAANYRDAGAQRLVLAGVIERRSDLAEYERACGGAVVVVRLLGAASTIEQRLSMRHMHSPEELAWHLARRAELDSILDAAQVSDADIVIAERTPTVATEVLQLAGW
ncbi:MAG TPA: hypothetical protein VFT67_11730 [Jatrophihabitantaceae bacterium]|nr:hypothetical protein [Jatrophihabitantaceae bacterium]